MMRRLHLIWLLAALVHFTGSAFAQYTKDWNPWPVVVDGDTLTAPYWGGVNFPKVSLVDFDGDGLVDLMVGEDKGKLGYFRNIGTAAAPEWVPQEERLGGIDVGTWHTFCDIDADGDPDVFCDGQNGQTAFYSNMSVGSNTVLKFETATFGGFQTGFNNTCDFADIDNDNDFDFFLGGATGELTLYRNDGDSANPSFIFVTNSYDNVLAFPGGSAFRPQHGFSALHFSDIDLDGDQDLFYGDIFNFNVYFFENFGTPALSDLTKVSEAWMPFSTFGFNHLASADLDDDTDLDLVVGVGSQDINTLYHLRNDAGSFVILDSNIVKTIDHESYGNPTFGDLDGDGDLDMLLGGENGRLWHFENAGTPAAPSFVLQSRYYKGIDVGLSSAPALVDWDCDADLDLLIGNDLGRIQFWRNTGSPSVFSPVLVTNQLGGIQVDQLASPMPVDLNGDGLRDLLVGEWDFNGFANVRLYENTGNNPDPTLVLVTANVIKRRAGDLTLPVVYDWDADGKKDLIVGSRYFDLTWYRNTATEGQFPDSNTFVAQPDTLPGYDDGYRLALRFVDIDSDGDDDVFVGEEDGGLNFYQRDGAGIPCDCPWQADIDGNGFIDATDLAFVIDIVFFGQSDVQDPACPTTRADFDANGFADATDLAFLIDHVFFGQPGPPDPCTVDTECP